MSPKSTSIINITESKRLLEESLTQDKLLDYRQILKDWFSGHITKSDLDHRCKRLFDNKTSIKLHNNFIISLIAKATSKGNLKKQRRPTISPPPILRPMSNLSNTVYNLELVDPLTTCPVLTTKAPHVDQQSPPFVNRQYVLPDNLQLQTRLLATASELGLSSVSEDGVNLISVALEEYLKSLLTTVLGRIGGCLTSNGPSICPPLGGRNPFKKNIDNRCLYNEIEEDKELELVRRHINANLPFVTRTVGLFDIMDGLKSNSTVIPSNTCFATNIHRIVSQLWYAPS